MKGLTVTLAAAAMSIGSAHAASETFDFETLPVAPFPSGTTTLAGTLTDITLSGTGLKIRNLGGSFNATYGQTRYLSTTGDVEQITMTFDSGFLADSVTILNPINGTVTSEVDTVVIEAFDLSNNSLGSITSSADFITLAVAGIAKVVFDDVNDSTGYVIGSIEITGAAIPVPAALPLFAAGLGALGALRRKTRGA